MNITWANNLSYDDPLLRDDHQQPFCFQQSGNDSDDDEWLLELREGRSSWSPAVHQQQQRLNATNRFPGYESFRGRMYHVVIPLICLFGVAGNAFNIYVFGRRWITRYMDQLERSATAGLVSLAVSDGMFCLVGFPAIFLRPPQSRLTAPPPLPGSNDAAWAVVSLHYNTYRAAAHSLFLLTSTWIIVIISIERFIAVSYAIKARWLIRVRLTVTVHAVVFLASFAVCLPLLLQKRVRSVPCGGANGTQVCYYVELWPRLVNKQFRIAYQVIWTSVGTFVPLAILVFSSSRLLVDLYRSKAAFGSAASSPVPDRYRTPQITTMVAAILLSFTVLVCPSMIVECLRWLRFTFVDRMKWQAEHAFQVAIVVTNLLQAVKFSSNFLLYCAVSRQFRTNFSFKKFKESFTSSGRTRDLQATTTASASRSPYGGTGRINGRKVGDGGSGGGGGGGSAGSYPVAIRPQSKTPTKDERKEPCVFIFSAE